MRISQAILDDIRHVVGILQGDSPPNRHAGAAGMLRNIADDIERAVETDKRNPNSDENRKLL